MTDAGDERDDALDRVARARAGAGSVRERYRDWAARYDHDVFEVLGVTGSRRIADLLAAHLDDLAAPVLDLGCGTGAVGLRLAELGVGTVDGVDISPEMLAVARATGRYRWTGVADLDDRSTLPGGPYGAAVSAGTFTSGHVGPAAVPSLLGLVEPGGVIAWVIARPVWPAFERTLARARIDRVSAELEAIRPGADPESVMFVGRLPAA